MLRAGSAFFTTKDLIALLLLLGAIGITDCGYYNLLLLIWQGRANQIAQREAAHIRQQIVSEYEAVNRVFINFTSTAGYEYITKRQELKEFVPPQEAIGILAQVKHKI